MPRRHGRQLRLWVAGYRISPDVGNVEEAYRADSAEVTVVEEDDRVFVPGQRGAELRFTGFYNDDDDHIDDVMNEIALRGTEDNDILIIRQNLQGAPGFAGDGGLSRDYAVNSPVGGPIAVTGAFLFSGQVNRVLVNNAHGTVTAAGTIPVSLDLGAESAPNGVKVFYQWDAIEGTVQVVTFMGAVNLAETTPIGTVLMTAAGGVGGTVIERTGAVMRHITDVWSLPGGTGTAAWVSAVAKSFGTV